MLLTIVAKLLKHRRSIIRCSHIASNLGSRLE